MELPLNFTCANCAHTEPIDDHSLQAIVNARRDRVMEMLGNDGGRQRGSIAFEQVVDEDGSKKLVARRRFPGVEVKSG